MIPRDWLPIDIDNLYVADDVAQGIRISKIVVLLDGSIDDVFTLAIIQTDGTGADIDFDADGNLFVADSSNEIWRIEFLPYGSVHEVAPFVGVLAEPCALDFDSLGNLFVSTDSGEVWTIDSMGTAGQLATGLAGSNGIAVDSTGIVYVSETWTGRILKIFRSPVEGDLDCDRDVDGKDLATYALGASGIDLKTCAAQFGKADCPPCP